MTVLRIAQEALLNIARHADADHVTLTLQCDDETMLLSIEDNGIGINPGIRNQMAAAVTG